MKDMEWMSQAVCATHPYGAEFWFPRQTGPAARRQANQAAEICRTQCPVMAQCRDYRDAMGYQFGVWGGRKTLAAKRVPATVIPPEHGTEARHKQHLREGTQPCQRCRDAANWVRQEREQKRRRRSA